MTLLGKFLQLILIFSLFATRPVNASVEDRLREEAHRRNQALVQQGYNQTQAWTLKGGEGSRPTLLNLLFPGLDEEIQWSFWMETEGGDASFRLLDPTGSPVISSSGKKSEVSATRRMAAGKYTLEIDGTKAMRVSAILGIKGRVVVGSDPDPERFKEYPASPKQGFHWPYLLFVPKVVKSPNLLVRPNNTGFMMEDLPFLRASAAQEIQAQARLAARLGCPLMVPVFPRPSKGEENLYLHALSRESLVEGYEALKRVDLQLLAMIQDAQARLKGRGLKLPTKVLLSGFSASGSFVNRFAMLHPEHVVAVACGSPGGWPVAPLAEFEGISLTYPVGIADVKALTGSPLNLESVKSVAWFFLLGDKDTNDAVPYRDSFSKADEDFIFRHFGPTPLARWPSAQRIYTAQGLKARFAVYPGVGHTVTGEMEADIADFFEKALKESSKNSPDKTEAKAQ